MLLLSKFHNFSTHGKLWEHLLRRTFRPTSGHPQDVDDDVGRIVCGVSLVM